MNKQVKKLVGIMFGFGFPQKDTRQGSGCKWLTWEVISGQTSKEVGKRDREDT